MKETTAPLSGLCPLFLSFTKYYKATQPKHDNLSQTLIVGSLHSCPWALGLEAAEQRPHSLLYDCAAFTESVDHEQY